MQHCTARPNDEVRAIDLFTSLGREGVQFRWTASLYWQHLAGSRRYLCLLITQEHRLIFCRMRNARKGISF